MEGPAILTKPGATNKQGQNLALFRIYLAYRTLLAIVLLILLASANTRQLMSVVNPQLYVGVALAYLASSIPLMGNLSHRVTRSQDLLMVVFLIDILAITVLADHSGGMSSGLPFLLIIPVAASAVLMTHRTLATLVAALSVLATLGDTVRLISLDVMGSSSLFPTGLLGLLIFAVSLMIQAVANRLRGAEDLAQSRALDLYNLQRLNEQIVQHMQTGILLVNGKGTVRVMNQAASGLLAPDRPITMEQGRKLEDYSKGLAEQFEHWKKTGLQRVKPVRILESAPLVIAHFRELQSGSGEESLVFVEDYTPITQQAQSLKLASLGRLAASIAHEIRNPLGAISHAAQLMQESPELSAPDRRLADIILTHSDRVNQIVENVMQISRREPPRPEQLALAGWLETFLADYLATLNREVVVTLHCENRGVTVEFDPDNLRRVLSNLLDNALRHSKLTTGEETARIEVNLDFATHQCLIDLIDTGEGVPAKDQAKLFEPFFTTVAEGSGMGLYLCKELCEVNNADLAYRKTSRGESCFRIAIGQPMG